MDPVVVKRMKTAWVIAWVGLTGVVFAGWGFKAAVVAAITFPVGSMLAAVAYFLFLLLGDVSVPARILVIALLFLGLSVELGAIVYLLSSLVE